MESAILMGIDLGTSSAKTVLIDQDGQLLSCATREYGIETPRPGWAEQDPQVWLRATLDTMGQALAQAAIPAQDVKAIGLSGQMHGMVCLDGNGRPLRPAIIWADQRSSEQVARIYRDLGKDQLGIWTANPAATGFMLATWLWMLENEADTCQRTVHLALPKDCVRYQLTGNLGSEPSDASSTLMFDTANRRWSLPLLDALDIDPGLLPPLAESAEIAGELKSDVAAATGLCPRTPVVYGGSDQALQALGHAVVQPGVVSCTIGTGGQLFAPSLDPVYDRQLRLHLFCHAIPDCWHLEAATLSAGLALKWLRDNVFEGKTYQDLAEIADKVTPGSEGLLFLPHLAGERTPYMDPDSTAAFYGLTLRHHRGHLVRAVMEGVVFALRQGLDLMLELGVPIERVVASGGGTRHSLWLRLQADIFNRPIFQTDTTEAAAVGAALLAGVGVGVYPDVRNACQHTVHWREDVMQPIPRQAARYEESYQAFCQLYPALDALDPGAGWNCV